MFRGSRAHKAVGIFVVFAVLLVGVPVANAAPLLSRVNEALRSAGISVSAVNQLGWAEGVITGHYTTFGQLVAAMKWHKQQGRSTPDSSKFTKAVAKAQGTVTKCINSAEMQRLSSSRVVVKDNGGRVWSIKITKGQYDRAVKQNINIGSFVKVCSKDEFKNLSGHIKPLYIDSGSVSSGGGGGGGGGT